MTQTQINGTQVGVNDGNGGTLFTTVQGGFSYLESTNGGGVVGFLQNGSGAAYTTMQKKMYDIVSVKDFGAKGDGSTDDTTAVQNAINSFTGPGQLFFPAGTYLISSSLVLPYNYYFFRVYGEGWGSQIKAKSGTAFDLLKWSPPAAGYNYHQVDNLAFNGNSNTGSGNLINTNGMGGIRMTDLFLTGIATGGAGIVTNGASATYNHDVYISDVYIDTTTGTYGIYVGALASDTQINNVTVQGRNGLTYSMYYASGCAHIITTKCHPYGASTAQCYVGTNSDSLWFSDCIFDGGGTSSYTFYGNGMNACRFSNCQFTYATSGTDVLTLTNSPSNQFNNCIFEAGSGRWGINENGTSNYNSFTQCIFLGSFSSGSMTLVGNDTVVRQNGAEYHITGSFSLPPNTTVYIGSGGTSTSNENAVSYIVPYTTGLLRKISMSVTTAPGASQSVVATLRHNASNSGITATISGSATSATGTGVAFCNEGDALDLQVTSSAGAATTIVRITGVVAF